ncbi:MAG: type III pantothenate kinase [Bacteroidota bacterium]
MPNLSIDIGNSRTKIGVFQATELIHQAVLPNLSLPHLNALLTNHSIENIIYSSVASLEDQVLQRLNQLNAIALSHTLPLPFENHYETPETLGKDRLAAVAGALQRFPKGNSLVIDAGTCITYDWLIAGKKYIGGNISLGWKMRLQAMHQLTNALPLVENVLPKKTVGKTTEEAMQNGAMLGAVLEMSGMIFWSACEWRQINVILTGGDSIFFANHLKRKIFVLPDLVLTGLNNILNYNVRLAE